MDDTPLRCIISGYPEYYPENPENLGNLEYASGKPTQEIQNTNPENLPRKSRIQIRNTQKTPENLEYQSRKPGKHRIPIRKTYVENLEYQSGKPGNFFYNTFGYSGQFSGFSGISQGYRPKLMLFWPEFGPSDFSLKQHGIPMAAPKFNIGRSPQHQFYDWLGPACRKYAKKIHIICRIIKLPQGYLIVMMPKQQKSANLWTFWPVIQAINHLCKGPRSNGSTFLRL